MTIDCELPLLLRERLRVFAQEGSDPAAPAAGLGSTDMADAPPPHRLSVDELAVARSLREQAAPVLAEGLVCALRDQPADPAAYMAEFLASAGGAGAQAALEGRKLGQECAKLDAQLAALKDQIEVAHAERARRIPEGQGNGSGSGAGQRNAAVAAASWNEIRRLKRLMRNVKLKVGEPLQPSDWPMPEGVLLVQGGRAMGGVALCEQLVRDFGLAFVDGGSGDGVARAGARAPGGDGGGGEASLDDVLARLRAHPGRAVLVHDFLPSARARERLDLCTRRVGKPTAVVLLHCHEPEQHATRLVETLGVARDDARAEAARWKGDELVALGDAALEARLPLVHVAVDGDFGQQMTQLLVGLTSV